MPRVAQPKNKTRKGHLRASKIRYGWGFARPPKFYLDRYPPFRSYLEGLKKYLNKKAKSEAALFKAANALESFWDEEWNVRVDLRGFDVKRKAGFFSAENLVFDVSIPDYSALIFWENNDGSKADAVPAAHTNDLERDGVFLALIDFSKPLNALEKNVKASWTAWRKANGKKIQGKEKGALSRYDDDIDLFEVLCDHHDLGIDDLTDTYCELLKKKDKRFERRTVKARIKTLKHFIESGS